MVGSRWDWLGVGGSGWRRMGKGLGGDLGKKGSLAYKRGKKMKKKGFWLSIHLVGAFASPHIWVETKVFCGTLNPLYFDHPKGQVLSPSRSPSQAFFNTLVAST